MASPKPLADQLGYWYCAYRLNQTLRAGLHESCGSWTFSQRSDVKTAW